MQAIAAKLSGLISGLTLRNQSGSWRVYSSSKLLRHGQCMKSLILVSSSERLETTPTSPRSWRSPSPASTAFTENFMLLQFIPQRKLLALCCVLCCRWSRAYSPRLSAIWGAFAAPIPKISLCFLIRRTSPLSGISIAGPLVLTQHKGNKRIGEAQTTIRSASPIVIEIAY